MSKKSTKAFKAIQVAFELEQKISQMIRIEAVKNGLTPSDQIRKILGLKYKNPQRPRLTISLTQEDYKVLGELYNIDEENLLAIKRKMINILIEKYSIEI